MLIPAFVAPLLTEEQTRSVRERASGIDAISSRSPAANPFCTSAEYPPTKFTPTDFGRAVQRQRIFDRIAAGYRREHRHGRHGQPLVDDRDAVHLLDLLAHRNETLREAADLVVHLPARSVEIAVRAGEEGNAHRDRPDVQILVVDHADGFQNVGGVEHVFLLRCGASR
jgi:hypothetical protein